jgi:hypothetical protein
MIKGITLSPYKESIWLKLYIFVTTKLGAPTKQLEVLICYDFHLGIYDERKDLMFATKLGLFLIGTIVVTTLVKLKNLINFTLSISLNLVLCICTC